MNNLVSQTQRIVIKGLGIQKLQPGYVYSIPEYRGADTECYRLKVDNDVINKVLAHERVCDSAATSDNRLFNAFAFEYR